MATVDGLQKYGCLLKHGLICRHCRPGTTKYYEEEYNWFYMNGFSVNVPPVRQF